MPAFIGDTVFEKNNGVKGRLPFAQGNTVAGLSASTTDDLLRAAGVKVKRGHGLA